MLDGMYVETNNWTPTGQHSDDLHLKKKNTQYFLSMSLKTFTTYYAVYKSGQTTITRYDIQPYLKSLNQQCIST